MLNSRSVSISSSVTRFCSVHKYGRYSSTQVSQRQHRKPGTKVTIPTKKAWAEDAVLQSLCRAIAPNPLKYSNYPMTCPANQGHSYFNKKAIMASLRSGKQAVDVLKSTEQYFFALDWIEGLPGFEKKNSPPDSELLPLEEADQSSAECVRVLEDLIQQKDAKAVAATYIRYLQSEELVPEDMTEKCFAFVAFEISRVSYDVTSSSLLDLLETMIRLGSPSPYAYSVCIRALKHSDVKTKNMFNLLRQKISEQDFPVDVETINHFLDRGESSQQSEVLALDLLKKMKQHDVRPNPATFMGYLQCLDSRNLSPKEFLRVFMKCLAEMEACQLEPSLEVYLKMLRIVLWLRHNNLAHALLDVIEKVEFRIADEERGKSLLSGIMSCIYRWGNLKIAKRVWGIFSQNCYSEILLHSLQQNFFHDYLKIIVRNDSMENIVSTLKDLVPARVINLKSLQGEIYDAALRHRSPEILPYAFAECCSADMSKMQLKRWFRTAELLAEDADESTLQQMKNISLFTVKRMKRTDVSSSILSQAMRLIAKSGDARAVKETLSDIQQRFPNVAIDDVAMNECRETISSSKVSL